MTVIKNLNEGDHFAENDLRELMQKNLQLSEEMHAMMKEVNNFIFWFRVGSFLKFLVIFLPIILGYFYLAPMLKDVFKQYQQILDIGQTVGKTTEGIDLKSLPPEIQKLIPKK